MPVSSYVVRYREHDKPLVLDQLNAITELALGCIASHGVAVVVETESCREASAFGERLSALHGVIDAVLVYHNFEDVSEDAEPPEQTGELAVAHN